MFAATRKVVTAFSQGVNQSSSGTDKVNSIINCHLATGRIGQPGMGPFSLTGQPNAMGGREVGGLANMLAAHLDLDKPAHREAVQTFWESPRIADKPGLKAVELFQAIEAGRVKAVWIMATNPLVSMPDADQVRRALEQCELVVVSDISAQTDTNAYAARAAAGPGLGRKGRHGHQFRAPHLAPARLSAGAGRSARRLARAVRGGARAWVMTVLISRRRRRFSTNTRACPRFATRARRHALFNLSAPGGAQCRAIRCFAAAAMARGPGAIVRRRPLRPS